MPTMQRIGSDLMTLVSRDRAPEHARYDFILNGYRKTMPWPRALGSLFKMHNETFNVWTHRIGLVWCVNKLAQTLTTVPCGARATAAIAVFLASACCCFACSATYHLIGTALPPGASAAMLKIDIVGIVTLIAGSWAPGLEFTIGRRAPLNAIAYLTTSAAFMVAALRVRVRDDDRVSMRVVCLVLSVCAGALPLGHWCAVASAAELRAQLPGFIGMFFFYGFGALLFVLQFPERWFPDKFDLWLSSHQLWHVCVLAAVVSWSSFCEGYVLESCA